MSGGAYDSTIASAASTYGVPPSLLSWQINQESGGNPNAYNPRSGATGIAQFLPSTAANPGYGIAPFDPTNPTASINGAAQYDAALYQQTGSWAGALSSYGTLPAPGQAGSASVWQKFTSLFSGPGAGLGGAGLPATPGTATPLWGGGAQVPAGMAQGGGAGGWMTWAGELALRLALATVGLVLIAGGFYLTGRTGSLGLGQINPAPAVRRIGKALR